MNGYFGPQVPHGETAVNTPIGEICTLCEEPVLETDSGQVMGDGNVTHRECLIRAAIGSVGHQRGECSCYGGQGNGDPEGLSPREAARAAHVEFMRRSMMADDLDQTRKLFPGQYKARRY